MWATFKRVGLSLLMAAGIAAFVAGCLGITQNPSYFPRLLPTGDIVRTHAKPPGWGYFTNFDPKACRLEVRPIESTNPVQTQHVILATIYDEHGKPRRKRRVEWMLEGVGNIVEVDESGYFPGRGYKVDNKYAVSYTDMKEHKITRGNNNPEDDFVVRPGQTWCVITSAVEGDTQCHRLCSGDRQLGPSQGIRDETLGRCAVATSAARRQPRRHGARVHDAASSSSRITSRWRTTRYATRFSTARRPCSCRAASRKWSPPATSTATPA